MDTRQVYAVLNNRTEEDESKGNIYIEENKCAICDEYMLPNENVVRLGCKDNQGRLTNHTYHYECILMDLILIKKTIIFVKFYNILMSNLF